MDLVWSDRSNRSDRHRDHEPAPGHPLSRHQQQRTGSSSDSDSDDNDDGDGGGGSGDSTCPCPWNLSYVNFMSVFVSYCLDHVIMN